MNLLALSLLNFNLAAGFREFVSSRQWRETLLALGFAHLLAQVTFLPITLTIPSVASYFSVGVDDAAWSIIRLLVLGNTVFLAARLGEKYGHVRKFFLATNRSYETIQKEVRRMLEEAKRVDAGEDLLFGPDGRGDELPQGLGQRVERLRRLQETKARLEEESPRAAQAPQEHPNEIRSEEAVKGQKEQGREPWMVESIPAGEANDVHQLLP